MIVSPSTTLTSSAFCGDCDGIQEVPGIPADSAVGWVRGTIVEPGVATTGGWTLPLVHAGKRNASSRMIIKEVVRNVVVVIGVLNWYFNEFSNKKALWWRAILWCRVAGSDRGHRNFQSRALPTELPRQDKKWLMQKAGNTGVLRYQGKQSAISHPGQRLSG